MTKYGKKIVAIFGGGVWPRCNRRWLWTSITSVSPLLSVEAMRDVAYHTVGELTAGSSNYAATYQGVTWHFASAENKALFEANPAKYAPAYGGWYAGGASEGKKVPTKPELWAIVDGQLYLYSSPKVHNKLFLANTGKVISKGESNWNVIFAISVRRSSCSRIGLCIAVLSTAAQVRSRPALQNVIDGECRYMHLAI